jgi:hypothetical protein
MDKAGEPLSDCAETAARELVGSLDCEPDDLHGDLTAAVWRLSELGAAAIPALAGALVDGGDMTRLRAGRVVELVLSRRHGFVPGRGFPSLADEEAMRAEWDAVGGYRPDAPRPERAAAAQRWTEWAQRAGQLARDARNSCL